MTTEVAEQKKTKWAHLPHDGNVICQITDRDQLKELDDCLELLRTNREARWQVLRDLAKELGFSGVDRVTQRGNMAEVEDLCCYITLPKKWVKPGYEGSEKYRKERKAAVARLQERVNKRLRLDNAQAKGNRKAWDWGWYSDFEGKLSCWVTPMSAAPIKARFKPYPIPEPSTILNRIIEEYLGGNDLSHAIMGEATSNGIRMRLPHLIYEQGIWFAAFPIERGGPQPESMELPKGFRRLRMSRYWQLREKAGV